MVLNPSSVRSPIRRAKSTASGDEIALAVDELLFSVRLLMVTLKPTTDEAGASSPVTNTLPVLALEFEFCDEEFDDPQPTPIMLSPSSKATAKILFIADSDVKICVKYFPGELRFASRLWKHGIRQNVAYPKRGYRPPRITLLQLYVTKSQ